MEYGFMSASIFFMAISIYVAAAALTRIAKALEDMNKSAGGPQ